MAVASLTDEEITALRAILGEALERANGAQAIVKPLQAARAPKATPKLGAEIDRYAQARAILGDEVDQQAIETLTREIERCKEAVWNEITGFFSGPDGPGLRIGNPGATTKADSSGRLYAKLAYDRILAEGEAAPAAVINPEDPAAAIWQAGRAFTDAFKAIRLERHVAGEQLVLRTNPDLHLWDQEARRGALADRCRFTMRFAFEAPQPTAETKETQP